MIRLKARIYGWSSITSTGCDHKGIYQVLTIGYEEVGVTVSVPFRESFHNAVNLLRLPWKPDIHQKPTQRDIKRIMPKVKAGQVCAKGTGVKFISTKMSSTSRSDREESLTYVAARILATSALETASVNRCK